MDRRNFMRLGSAASVALLANPERVLGQEGERRAPPNGHASADHVRAVGRAPDLVAGHVGAVEGAWSGDHGALPLGGRGGAAGAEGGEERGEGEAGREGVLHEGRPW